VYRDLLAQSPLLALPLAALLIFVAVFVFVLLRTMARGSHEYSKAAALPFEETSDDRA
jgi:cbb3-type cytochrome oxidase subunit 3